MTASPQRPGLPPPARPVHARRILLALSLPPLAHASPLSNLMVMLRQTVARLGACGGALFDGERLLALLEGPGSVVDELQIALLQGAPARALGLQRSGLFEQGVGGQTCPPWRLAFVAPEQLSSCLDCAERAQRSVPQGVVADDPVSVFLATLAQAACG